MTSLYVYLATCPNALLVVVWVATLAFGIPALDICVILTEIYASIKGKP